MEARRTRFGRLTVDYIRDGNEYHCVCDCGNKIIVFEEQLNDNSSCGCLHREFMFSASGDSSAAREFVTLANTVNYSESRGINFEKSKNKWRARVTFQAKEYHLGYFSDKEEALEIRRKALSNLNTDFLDWYKEYRHNS